MFNLIPEHTKDFDYLYRLVTDRNKWFIRLRYGAVAMLLIFFIYLQFFSTKASAFQNTGILVICLFIFLYNVSVDILTRRHEKSSDGSVNMPMSLAFAQIVCDLMMLLGLVYVTGLLDSPFSIFFVFHAIIGSMILPGRIVSGIFVILLLVFSALVLLVETGLMPYFDILSGDTLVKMSVPKTLVFLSAYWVMLLMSVKFANSLASAHFRREQELNEAMKKIESAELEKQKYVMAVVHEIKSPIAAITSYLNILLGGLAGELNDKVKDILKKSKTRADDAIVLTNDILDVSRVKLLEQVKKEPVYLEKIIYQAIDSMKSKIEDKEIDFEQINLSDRCSQINADKRLMELVISNILTNAVKYTPSKGMIRLKIDNSKGEMSIEVSDNGIGVPPDEQKDLFNEFFRASNAKKEDIEGTGLGLAAVKQAVDKNGGNIRLSSPGELESTGKPGTTVRISFPVNDFE
jgi:signal transduction histidine kinase